MDFIIKQLKTAPWRISLPIFSWLKHYTRADFQGDFFAGIITAILLVPQGIAYAMLAGLPAQTGLYASLLPPIFYAIFGTSRTMSVGPVSIAAIMIASALSAPAIQSLGNPVESGVILAAEGGLILLLMALLRMGGLVNFISHPVLTGFTSGASILIILSQIPHLLGLPKPEPGCGMELICYSTYLAQLNSVTFNLGLLSLGILIFFARPLTLILNRLSLPATLITGISKSAPLLAVMITALLVSHYNLADTQHVAVVGVISGGLPDLNLSFIASEKWSLLLPYAGFIALIAYVESVAIAKVTANIKNQRIDPNHELIALGFANLATSVSGGMSVAGGFSRTMVNFSAGARTQMAMLIAVIILGIALMFFSSWFTYIPKTTLAAIILLAIFPLVKLGHIIQTWRYDIGDGLAELNTFLGVLIFGIEEGLTLGILITIFSYLRKTSRPHIAVVGRIPNTEHYRNVKRHLVETWSNLLLLRVDENITFANASYIEEYVLKELSANADIKHIVFIFTSVSFIDKTAFEALQALNQQLRSLNVILNLAEIKGPVMDKLKQTDFISELRPGRIYFRVDEAVAALADTNTP